MTRETKVGLVVAGSFLCLVGIVVASKWNRGEPGGDAEEQSVNQVAAVKPTPEKNKGEPKKSVATPKKTNAEVIVPASTPSTPVAPAFPPASPANEPNRFPSLTIPPPLGGDDDPFKKTLQQFAQNNAPPSSQKETNPSPMTPAFPVEVKPQGVEIPPPSVLDPKIVAPKPLDNKPAAAPMAIEFPPLKPAPTGDDKKDPKDIPSPVVKPGGLDPLAKPVPNPLENPGGIQFKPLEKKEPPTSFPPITPPEVVKKDNLPPAKDPPLIQPKEIVKPTFVPTPDPQRVEAAVIPKPPVIPPNNPNDGGQLPVAPAIVIGGPKPLPVVKDWSTDVYETKPGEDNFAILSLRMYGSEKYADALLAYNRAHGGGIKNPIQGNPPVLNPGQQVLKPPVGLLERDFRSLIRDGGVPTIGATAPSVKLTPPMPLQGSPVAGNVSNPPLAASGRVYTVQSPNGESILDIAERTLGSHREWFRIAALNPQYQPQFRIPAGTQLKLP